MEIKDIYKAFDEKQEEPESKWMDSGAIIVSLNGEVVLEWYDNQNVDSPEDLTWARTISDVFYKGVLAGVHLVEGKEAKSGNN